MADPIREAEEALATFDAFCAQSIDEENSDAPTLREAVLAMESALRALLPHARGLEKANREAEQEFTRELAAKKAAESALAMKRREYDVEAEVHNATRHERDRLLAECEGHAEMREEINALTNERNAALELAEKRGAAYDMTWREVESLRERLEDEDGKRIERLCNAAGIYSPLQLSALATTNEETTLDLLVRRIAVLYKAESALAAERRRREEGEARLVAIRTYEPKEVVKDEFAYDRMVEAYRLAAASPAPPAGDGVRELPEAVREQFTRRPTAEELWVDVVRLVREANTPAEIEAAGMLVGRITALGKMLVSAAAAPTPEPPPPPEPAAPAETAPEPAVEEEAA